MIEQSILQMKRSLIDVSCKVDLRELIEGSDYQPILDTITNVNIQHEFKNSPVRAPAHVARGEVFVACSLLDEDIDLLLEVLLIEDGTNADLLAHLVWRLLHALLWVNLGLLVRIVELEATKLVLNALDDDFGNLVQLVAAGIFVTLLFHKLVDLVVLHAS